MLGVVVVNYRQTGITLECLNSLERHAGCPFSLVVVDNASDDNSRDALTRWVASRPAGHAPATLIHNGANLGFAAACNQGLEHLLTTPGITAIALLNNDTLVEPDWLRKLAARLDPERRIHMVATRMLDLQQPTRIDNLGIVLFRSAIASNRMDPAMPLLGPCGGGALYSRELLTAVRAVSGRVFDEDFFCYAEDTDLALRARALGFECGYAPDAVLRHHGSLSSGGAGSRFVAYYGLRNALFAAFKTLPAGFFLRNLHWVLLLQGAVIFKYLIKGDPLIPWRVYRDCLRALPRLRRQRQCIRAAANNLAPPWTAWVCPRFYDPAYLRREFSALWRRG